MVVKLRKGQDYVFEQVKGMQLNRLCVGVSWNVLPKKTKSQIKGLSPMHLDASLGVFDKDKMLIDCVYYGKLSSKCGSVHFFSDFYIQNTQDKARLDHEVLQLDVSTLPDEAHQLALVVHHDRGCAMDLFSQVRARVYEGQPTAVEKPYCEYDIAQDCSFVDATSIIIAKLFRSANKDSWVFRPIGASTQDQRMSHVFDNFAHNYF